MKQAHVCFYWHMHQPYYTDPVTQSAGLPWVRLHAIEAYYDMACLLEQFPAVRATFNFTPSLLLQLKELTAGTTEDLFHIYARRPAEDLSSGERAFIVRHFFAANWETMVRPYPRYHELLIKRGTDVRGQDLEQLARPFSSQDLLDLQIWHNLAWFGHAAVSRYPRLAHLRRKDRGFTEEDKHEILALQHQVMGEVIARYRSLSDSGQIELTTSPFYHPILPLVFDTDFARRARPDLPMPQRFHAPADAEAQLRRGSALHTELFGRAPRGLWPSEGSVCPEIMPLVRRAGFQWLASDEGILARSLGHWHRAVDLYRPYQVGHPDDAVTIVFRDRELSDAIGFVYSRSPADSAVDDLLRRLREVVRQGPEEDMIIPIILDGENPWEYFHDGGRQFLTKLYATLSEQGVCGAGVGFRTATISDALDLVPAGPRLDHLHSGSWINHDFQIWIGHQEDNRGWDLLRETRARLAEVERTLPPNQATAAWEALYAAEGSDWFWWYGDDFQTDYKSEFDRLFRTHLRNVYIRANLPPPDFLDQPIASTAGVGPAVQSRSPVNLLFPTVDGLVSDFFEWRGAGQIDPAPPLGAMWTTRRYFTHIGFGFSLDAFFLRLDPDEELVRTAIPAVGSVFIQTRNRTFKASFSLSDRNVDTFILASAAHGEPFVELGRSAAICRRSILELAIPFKDLSLRPGQEFRISLVVTQNELEMARYPRLAPVNLTVPDANFEAMMWRV